MPINVQLSVDLGPRQKRVLRAALVAGGVIGALGLGIAVAAPRHTFTAGATISASQMNENFVDLDARLTALETAAAARNFRVGAAITTAAPIIITGPRTPPAPLQSGTSDATMLENDAGSGVTPAKITCEAGVSAGAVCPAGVAEQLGIVFQVPTAGDYQVCASFSATVGIPAATDYMSAFFRLNETTPSSPTPLTSGKNVQRLGSNASTGEATAPFHLCEVLTFASAGEKAVRLFEHQAGTASAGFELGAGVVRFDITLVLPR